MRFVYLGSFVGTAFGLAVLVRDQYQGARYESDIGCRGKTVVITGANSGLGKETAKEIASRGGRVIMACRDLKSALQARNEIIDETSNKNVHVKHLDLSSLDSIAEFARDINSSEERLDILVNNAALMDISKRRQVTKDGFELHLGVNYLGAFLLTNLLLPKLRESKPSRVVNITTISMNKASIDFNDFNSATDYDPYRAYPKSKLALMSFTQLFSQYYKDLGVTSYAVYPGIAPTRLARGLAKSTISSTIFKPTSIFMRSPQNAIQTVIYCCLEPDIEKESGKCFKDLQPLAWTSQLTKEDSIRLWKISHVWTQLDKYRDISTDIASDIPVK